MKRRDALKNIGLSAGLIVATPTVISLLNSCSTDSNKWSTVFLNKEQAKVLMEIVDVIIPKTDTPSANEVNVVEDAIAIKRYVRNLVLTNLYERPFHPELGCGIRGLLFENFNPDNSMFLKSKIEQCIVNNQSRIVFTGILING